jgi:hypothetical protein
MTKVRIFTLGNSHNILHHSRLTDSINAWLEQNNVEVVDIKYSTSAYINSMGGECWVPSALLIYKDKE